MRGHPKPQDLPPAVADDQQSIEQSIHRAVGTRSSARQRGPLRQCHSHGCEGTSSIPTREGPSSAPYTWRRWSGRSRCRA
jgi:hypothetical protein